TTEERRTAATNANDEDDAPPPEPPPFPHHPALPPPSPIHPERPDDVDTAKSNRTAARRRADDVHDPGGQTDAPDSVPPSVRLEGEKIRRTSLRVELTDVETNDVDETSAEEAGRPPGQSKARKPPRDPVGTPDGDTRRPNGPTKPPDEEEGADGGDGEQEVESTVGHVETNELGRVEVEGVENVETKESRRGDKPRGREDKGEESRQVDEPGDEGNEELRSREVEGELGDQSEGDGCQRDGRTIDTGDATSGTTPDSKRVEAGPLADDETSQQRNGRPNVSNHSPTPSTPSTKHTNRPTHHVNPPRRRGRLKTLSTNVSRARAYGVHTTSNGRVDDHPVQSDATETVWSYRGSVPKPPQSRTKGTKARTSIPTPSTPPHHLRAANYHIG
ncbi:hypothetical protein PAXINDRAFT_17956, partial [Paxillus involutus ATCC 200175]